MRRTEKVRLERMGSNFIFANLKSSSFLRGFCMRLRLSCGRFCELINIGLSCWVFVAINGLIG
jgi:hypothetical protein